MNEGMATLRMGMKRAVLLMVATSSLWPSNAFSQAQTDENVTCTLLEWHGRDIGIVQSWLGEELSISFEQRRIHIRHGERWYMDIPFTLQESRSSERRISFEQTGTYDGQRHSIDFSYVLNSNGTVSGYATSSSLGTITANGTCLAEAVGTS